MIPQLLTLMGQHPGFTQFAASFGMPALARMFGAGAPEQEYYDALRKAMDPRNEGKFTTQRLMMLRNLSGAARNDILTGQLSTQQALGRAFAASGMDQTGIGAAGIGLASSGAARGLARLNSDIGFKAADMGHQDFLESIAKLQSLGPRPASGLQTIMGQGLGNFGPALQQMLQNLPKPVPKIASAGNPNSTMFNRGLQMPLRTMISNRRFQPAYPVNFGFGGY